MKYRVFDYLTPGVKGLPQWSALMMVVCLLLGGCSLVDNSEHDETANTAHSSINDNPAPAAGYTFKHPLDETQAEQVMEIYKILAEVDSRTLEEWIEEVSDELIPDSVIANWLEVATAYKLFVGIKDLPMAAKKEAYMICILRSALPETEVIAYHNFQFLSLADAKQIMSYFSSRPGSIKVIARPADVDTRPGTESMQDSFEKGLH
jgi:hypothetical protein